MSARADETTLELVRRVVELNTDGEHVVALSAADIAETLDGSGLSETEVAAALAELVREGELVRTDEGFAPPGRASA